tara:strand:- start:150 stop:314 length:165 start_codon:yes stop_codon:yes gene_type:complete
MAKYPSADQKELIKYLEGEDQYNGSLSWEENKLSSKFNYEIYEEKTNRWQYSQR